MATGNDDAMCDDAAKMDANREIGDPGVPVWHSRGYLPHVEWSELIQHVTFHMADSLPKAVVERLDAEVGSLPVANRNVERRMRVDAWLDAGHGSCALREPAMAAVVQDAFLKFDTQRYHLVAWVVMPNHVHVLFQPMEGWTVAKIVASWKKFTARKIGDHRRNAWNAADSRANREIGGPEGYDMANREIGGPVWHREYWDRYIRDEQHLWQAVDYIHQNPVKAGLARSAEEWPWSSARRERPRERQSPDWHG